MQLYSDPMGFPSTMDEVQASTRCTFALLTLRSTGQEISCGSSRIPVILSRLLSGKDVCKRSVSSIG